MKELQRSGQFEESVTKGYELLGKYEDHAEFNGYFLLRLGGSLCLAKKCKVGLQYFYRALAYGTQFSDSTLLGRSYYGLGAGYQFLHQDDSAYYFYNQAKRYLDPKTDSLNLIGIEENLTMLLPDFDGQFKKYLLLASIRQETEDMHGIAGCYYNIGDLCAEHLKYDTAYDYYLKSYQIAQANGYRNDLIKAQRGLAISAYYMGDTKEAFGHFLAYDSAAAEWLYGEDYNDKILELETKYKTMEVERDNARKQTEIEERRNERILLYLAIFLLIFLLIIGFLYLDQRRRRIKSDALRKQEQADQKIQDIIKEQEVKTAYALLSGQDHERKRVAGELHDRLGNILATLTMYADTIALKPDRKDINKLMNKISQISKSAHEEVRKVSHQLDSGVLTRFGLKTAILQLMETIESAEKIEVEMEWQLEEELSSEVSLQLYRIIQELVTNCLKHSDCQKIRLDFTQVKNEISLIFTDDGRGFNVKDVQRGMGLYNIRQRVKRLNGTMSIESVPKQGSTFIIEIMLYEYNQNTIS